ncbi:winged helix-turn-helix transcriptional regulator [Mycobacterium yunnanensis]|uniref:Winged helix-turn-helix transcriptional regulator n=1 Tax=Mycobacterium yunnanensis TaxID=368477 RepID=A0A9X3C3P8_9MYCO|nr:MarR family winged helix-turn-helix transcriptional regulator [Mycobacterium yunnanensis]MCV7422497.1 winged helix-turn-helix transcriptional regulator [Mycobacterium yunnanensis]
MARAQTPTDRGSVLADLADAIMHAARLIRSWDQAAETVVPLSTVEAAVLEYVDRHPGCRPSDVARDLRMRSSNFSAALRVLDEQGFVERRSDPTDGRTANLVVTALAKRNIDVIRTRRAALLATALGDEPTRVEDARELLDRLRSTPATVD